MDPGGSRCPASAGVQTVIVADPAWRRMVRKPETVAARAAAAAGGATTVVLAIQVWRHVPVAFAERVPGAERTPQAA